MRCGCLGREPEAIAAYDRALAGAPQHLNAWLNRGHALAALNRHRDAVASYDRALALQPDHADAHFNAALSLLTVCDYARGLKEYEWRWKRTGMIARKEFRQPPWLGETPLSGKTIVLHAEQGLGDTVQFARYVPHVARMGAKVVLEVPAGLKTLLRGFRWRGRNRGARRKIAALRSALPARQPAARLQDRCVEHPGRYPLSPRAGIVACEMAAAPGEAAVAARGAGMVRELCASERQEPLAVVGPAQAALFDAG